MQAKEDIRSARAGIAGSCEILSVASGKQIQVFCKCSVHSITETSLHSTFII